MKKYHTLNDASGKIFNDFVYFMILKYITNTNKFGNDNNVITK